MPNFEEQLREIIDVAVKAANEAFRSQLLRLANGSTEPARPQIEVIRPKKSVKAVKVVKRNYPPHCVAPRCKNPHKGPGSSFLCEKHRARKLKKEK